MRTNHWVPVALLACILAAAAQFLFTASVGDSAVMDEQAHIPAGYAYVRYLDYRLNPEHPPLLKGLAAVPLLFLNLNFPTNIPSWTTDVNGQWATGFAFLYNSGNDADQMLFYARLVPIFLTLLTILFIYIWGTELVGRWWALLPATLFGLSPTVLAHGHYVTTDVAATFGFLIATYFFLKWILHPSRAHLLWAGLAVGIAELLKFSLVLLGPDFLILTLIFVWAERRRQKSAPSTEGVSHSRNRTWYYLKGFVLVFVIGYLVVYGVYALVTLHYPQARQLSDATNILLTFNPRFLADGVLALIRIPFLRPIGQYCLGVLMTLQRSAGGNTGYLMGEVTNLGWWYYFPVVFLLKETIPALLLLLGGSLIGLKAFFKNLFGNGRTKLQKVTDYLGTRFPEFAFLFFIVFYWAYSIRSPLNIGFRHILPTIPFMYLLAAGALKAWAERTPAPPSDGTLSKSGRIFKTLRSPTAKIGLIVLVLFFAGRETVAASPYFLSYFNQLAGGTANGYRYVVDSNYDWGQDLLRLRDFVAEHNIQTIAVDYFGGGDPEYYLGKGTEVNWWSARGNPKDQNIEWFAVSVGTLENAMGRFLPNPTLTPRKPEDEYGWLKELRPPPPGMGQVPTPDFRVGTSIFVYHL